MCASNVAMDVSRLLLRAYLGLLRPPRTYTHHVLYGRNPCGPGSDKFWSSNSPTRRCRSHTSSLPGLRSNTDWRRLASVLPAPRASKRGEHSAREPFSSRCCAAAVPEPSSVLSWPAAVPVPAAPSLWCRPRTERHRLFPLSFLPDFPPYAPATPPGIPWPSWRACAQQAPEPRREQARPSRPRSHTARRRLFPLSSSPDFPPCALATPHGIPWPSSR